MKMIVRLEKFIFINIELEKIKCWYIQKLKEDKE